MKNKKTKEQRAADAAFIEKIKSINIGGKPLGEHKCPGCGEPIGEHDISVAKVSVVKIPSGFFTKGWGPGGNPATN